MNNFESNIFLLLPNYTIKGQNVNQCFYVTRPKKEKKKSKSFGESWVPGWSQFSELVFVFLYPIWKRHFLEKCLNEKPYKTKRSAVFVFCWSHFHSSSLQWAVPQTPAGPVHPSGGAIHWPDGDRHCPVHPPWLWAGDLAFSQVRLLVSCFSFISFMLLWLWGI